MENLFEYLLNKGIDKITIEALKDIILCEEYDSESICYDVLNETNILLKINNRKCLEFMKKFIENTQSM